MELGGFDIKTGDKGVTVWWFPAQLQTAPKMRVQVKFWAKSISATTLFHSLQIDFHCNRVRYRKLGKYKRGIENFKKTVTEQKRPDGSLDFKGEVKINLEFDARFATLSGGFQPVTADPELKARFEAAGFMGIFKELKALRHPDTPQHIVIDIVVRKLQIDVGEDDKVPKWPADPVLIAAVNSLPGETNCFAVEGEESNVYTIPSIDEEYDFARYRTKFGEPRCTTNQLCNRAA
jgi:hypothetical protein